MQHIYVRVFNDSPNELPTHSTPDAVGADIRANLLKPIIIPKGKQAIIPTGIYMEIPSGYEVQVRPRSGLAFKNAISIVNSPGTIDADYRGEIKVVLRNNGFEHFTVNHGDRIAQLIIKNAMQFLFEAVDNVEELAKTERGEGGFGSTGKD